MNRPILDIYDDTNGGLLRKLLPTPAAVPDFVKQASTDLSGARDDDFALLLVRQEGVLRKFACTDPGNTALSVLYYMETRGCLPEEQSKLAAHNLAVACQRHHLAMPEELWRTAGWASANERAFYQTPYCEYRCSEEEVTPPAALHKTAAGLELDTAEEVQHALFVFNEQHQRLSPRERWVEATTIEKRAAELGVPCTGALLEYNGDSYSAGLPAQLAARRHLCLRMEDKLSYSMLSKVAAELPPEEFAEALSLMDESTGLSEHWGRLLDDPYKAVLQKKAAAPFVFSGEGGRITEDDLQRLAANGRLLLVRQFGESLAEGFCKNPVQIFRSLPRPQQVILMRMALDSGTAVIGC